MHRKWKKNKLKQTLFCFGHV